jgi:hypothetical protein
MFFRVSARHAVEFVNLIFTDNWRLCGDLMSHDSWFVERCAENPMEFKSGKSHSIM